jgi:membrane peptidoglycan carboxypeptidase
VSRILRLRRYLAPLLRAGLITGIAVAVVAFPLAAIGGLGVLGATDIIDQLPDKLRAAPSAQVSSVYASDGTIITQFYEEYRRYVPLDAISPNMLKAIIASEDTRFYEHRGVDTKGVVRAFIANRQAGAVSQGASTLTMQYVRNVQRDSAETPQQVTEATDRTSARKLKEMRLAVAVEKQWSKEEILEKYLNVAYFGHRAYGIYAAAEVFFSKRPKDLTLAEAATLAGLVKAPSAYDPAGADKTAALNRRNYVIDRMTDIQYLSRHLSDEIKKTPIELRLTSPPNDCIAVNTVNERNDDWGFFCDMLKSWWRKQEAFGKTPQQREENLRRGGYKIVTSLDPRIQDIAMQEVTNRERLGSSYALGLVAVEPGTGKIKAAAVNRRYSLDQTRNGPHTDWRRREAKVASGYPNTVAPLLGGGDMPGYQAGSTFKIFTMVAALDAGLPLNTRIFAPQTLRTNYSGNGGACGVYWCPHNASGAMTGVQDMWSGFGKSVNTYFVQLEQRIGAERAVRMAERLGLGWHTDVDQTMASPEKANGWGAFTLGVADTTPLEMANAYATLAADGQFCEATPIQSITDPAGQVVAAGTPKCHQAVRPEVARAAVDASRCVTGYGAARGGCGGWSTAPGVYGSVGRPVAGKTGTTDDTRSAWFVGITPDLAAASFIADPDNPFHVAGDGNSNKPIQAVSGVLRRGLAGSPVRPFTPPSVATAQQGAR